MLLAGAVWVFYGLTAVQLYPDAGIRHFLMARYAVEHPEMYADIWGRPLLLLLYTIPARINLDAARLLSAVMSVFTLWLMYAYAARSGYGKPWLAPALLAVMPGFIYTAYNVTDTLPVCLLLVLSLYLMSAKRYLLSGLAISLVPLARPDAVLFIPIFAAVYLSGGRWKPAVLTLTGVMLWSVAGLLVFGGYQWHQLAASGMFPGAGGGPLYFLKRLPAITDPVLLAPFIAGMVCGLKEFRKGDNTPVVGVWLSLFAFYSVVGLLGSFPAPEFGTVAPLVALIALKGVTYLLDEKAGYADAVAAGALVAVSAYVYFSGQTPHYMVPVVAGGIFIILRALVLSGWFGPMRMKYLMGVVGLTVAVNAYAGLDPMDKPSGLQAAAMEEVSGVGGLTSSRFVLATNLWFYYYAGIDPFDPEVSAKTTEEGIIDAPVGSMIVYEPDYSVGGLDGRKLSDCPVLRLAFSDDEGRTMIFEKTGEIPSPYKGMFTTGAETGP